MRPKQLVEELEARGLRVSVAGTDLRLQGPRERIDADLVERIKAYKAELIAYLTELHADQAQGFPLTLLQRGYLIGRGSEVELGNVASYVYHEIDGCWDLRRLQSSLQSVVDRHGMLRTYFTEDGRQVERPPPVEARVEVTDLRGQDEAVQRERLAAWRAERGHRILPSHHAPLLAVEVSVLADDRMRLHVGHDGLVMDGISMFIFFRDWFSAYSEDPSAATDGGSTPGTPGEASFEAYMAALETARSRPPAARSRDYWFGRLTELAPYPDLPLAAAPSAITHPRFVPHEVRLQAEEWKALKERAAASGVTATVLLLTAYAQTLARWGAGRAFTLNSTLANRLPIHPRMFDAIGNFNETMLIEVDLDPPASFEEHAKRLQAQLRRDIDNRHFSGIEVLRELGRRKGTSAARMPFTFNSAIGYVQADLDGSTLELFGPEVYTSSQTPQVWLNFFAFEQHGGVVIQFDEIDGLFPDGMIEAMVAGFRQLLTDLRNGPAWAASTFDLLPAEQRIRRRQANDTAVDLPPALAHDAFVAHARRHPERVAIVTADSQLTYGELYRRAWHAAAWLRSWKVGPDELVGLVMTRGPEQVVGILASVMAGGAYLPIDAHLPAERKRYMLRDGRVRCVLSNQPSDAEVGDDLEFLRIEVTGDIDRDVDSDVDTDVEDYSEALGAEDSDLAYVLYTSGTTGEPKGVMVSHRSVANVVADCNRRFGVGPTDRFFAISAFNFDLSVYDVFGALSAGAALVVPDAERSMDPDHWFDLCQRAGVTVWNSVPAIVRLLCDQAADAAGLPAALRLVMMSGDRIPPDLPARVWRLKKDLTLISLGGPTETTIWNIFHPIGPEHQGQTIPYGRPNSNNRAFVLDTDGEDSPDWVTGEICAAGTGLARGYWGDEARTGERFFDDPKRGERIFRTGDLGRYLPDGDIEILGRSDFQIKINGYRIEAGEVETRLAQIGGVKQAAVVREAGPHGDRLVAHLVPDDADHPDCPSDEALKQNLRRYLPEYMTPSVFVWHLSLPLTRNGKVDRRALSAEDVASGASAVIDAAGPLTEVEREVTAIWAGVLRSPVSDIGPSVTFPDLGGDSLSAVRVLTAVRKRFGIGITLDRMYEVDTVRKMAAHIESAALR